MTVDPSTSHARFSDEYDAYIRSPQWRRKRLLVFAQRGRECESCGSTESLEVDHLTYERLGHERISDLIVLCRACHQKVTGARRDEHARPGHGYRTVTSEVLGVEFPERAPRKCREPGCDRLWTGSNVSGLCGPHWKARHKAKEDARKASKRAENTHLRATVPQRRCEAPGCGNLVARGRVEPLCGLHAAGGVRPPDVDMPMAFANRRHPSCGSRNAEGLEAFGSAEAQ